MSESVHNLSDGVITLRPPSEADAPAIFLAVVESLPELKPWLSWAHDGYSIEETRDWLQNTQSRWSDGSLYYFIITEALNGLILGGCGLNIFSETYRIANLGYWVRTSRRGEGIAGRAALLLARYAIETLSIVRVEISVAEKNQASLRVAEKIGARREGLLRNRIRVGDKLHSAWMHSLIPTDFDTES